MSISLTIRAVTVEEWQKVTKYSVDEISSWLFASRKPPPLQLSLEEIGKLTNQERVALVTQRFDCCDVYTDRAVMDYRWCKMVDVIVGLKQGLEPSGSGSAMPHLMVGSFATLIPSVYGNVRVFPAADVHSIVSRIDSFDWSSSKTNPELVISHPDLAFLNLEALPSDIDVEVWYTVERIYKLLKRFSGGDHFILEYSH